MFEIFYSNTFNSNLNKLQKHEIIRIEKKLMFSLKNLFNYFEKLYGTELFKIRIGKFRVIVSINFNEKKITCLSIGLRKNIYAKLNK